MTFVFFVKFEKWSFMCLMVITLTFLYFIYFGLTTRIDNEIMKYESGCFLGDFLCGYLINLFENWTLYLRRFTYHCLIFTLYLSLLQGSTIKWIMHHVIGWHICDFLYSCLYFYWKKHNLFAFKEHVHISSFF